MTGINSPMTPAEQWYGSGDVAGFWTMCVIVAVVVILGAASLMRWRAEEAGVDDFKDEIDADAELLHANRADVLKLEDARKKMVPRVRR